MTVLTRFSAATAAVSARESFPHTAPECSHSGTDSVFTPTARPVNGTLRTGAASTMRLLLAPLGRHAAGFHVGFCCESRLQHGLAILLPGIDGCTTVSDNIARGLERTGIPSALEVHDWRSFPGWNPLHLATARRNRDHARQICERILGYRREYPNRPVHLIGHSAGAGIALFVLQELPADVQIQSVVLLAAAVSRRFEVRALAPMTVRGIWSFWSRGDLPAVGLGTMIFGTMDRQHTMSAGALGFKNSDDPMPDNDAQLHEVGYRFRMARSWNFGGHFGCTNTVFVSRYVAPIICGQVHSVGELLRA